MKNSQKKRGKLRGRSLKRRDSLEEKILKGR
jgi:hypothetical protein